MISFLRIGSLGRSGNILFQLAATYAQSLRLGVKFTSPDWSGRELFELSDQYRPIPIRASSRYGWEILHRALPRKFESMGTAYDPAINLIKNGTDLKGYFQSERYFESFADRILNFFSFREGAFKRVVATISERLELGDAVAVHLRRGDYAVASDTHPLVGLEYYQRAFEVFSGSRFVVFSDSPGAARALFPDLEVFMFSDHLDVAREELGESAEGFRAWIEFALMSSAASNIIANSSFSWWAAYLNRSPGKRVIAPAQWYGAAIARSPVEYEDLYPRDWTRL